MQAHQGVSYGDLNIIHCFSRFYPQNWNVVPNMFLQSAGCTVDARCQFVRVHVGNHTCYTDSWVKEQSKPIAWWIWYKAHTAHGGEHSQSFGQYNSLHGSLLQAAVSQGFGAWIWWDEFNFLRMLDNRIESTPWRFWKEEQRQACHGECSALKKYYTLSCRHHYP